MAQVRIDIASEFKDKGFKKADTAATALDRRFKALAKTFIAVFSTRAIINFGRASLKAFEEDEKAATRLTQTLNGLNMGFADPAVKRFISDVEAQTGILDDELRPAMQTLLSQTRSLTQSQNLLNLAIEVSRGSGYSLATVTSDLAKAYVGNNRALTKYNLGLSKTELQTADFLDIQQRLTKQFTGQNAAYLETYAGKVGILNVAYANMQEQVGSGLVDAFAALAGKNGITGAADAMVEFGSIAGNVIRGVGAMIGNLTSALMGKGGLRDALSLGSRSGNPLAQIIQYLDKFGQGKKALEFPTLGIGAPGYAKQQKQLEKEAAKRQRELIALQKKQVEAQKKAEEERKKRERLALAEKRANTVFDMQNIQIVAALQEKVDGETRLRLTALLALNTSNSVAAEKLADMVIRLQAPALANLDVFLKSGDSIDDMIVKLITSQAKLAGLQLMAEDFPIPEDIFQEWEDSLDEVLKKLMEMLGLLNQIGNKNTGFFALDKLGFSSLESYQNYRQGERASIVNSSFSNLATAQGTALPTTSNISNGMNVVVNVAGNVTTESDLVNSITNALYQSQKDGKNILYSSTAI
jgi:hypothetical protein